MKVLHIITTLERGGAEKQLAVLARHQKILGEHIVVAALKGNLELKNDFLDSQVIVFDNLRNRGFLRQIYSLRKFIKKEKFDLLHLHLPRAEILGSLATFGIKISLIASRHNSESFYPNAPHIISALLSRLTLSRVDHVIAISESVQRFLTLQRELSSNTSVSVIYYGYDDRVKSQSRPRKMKPNEKLEKFIALNRLVPQKDIPTMIEAMSFYRRWFGFGELTIYGEGHLRNELISQTRKLGIDAYVNFGGRIVDIEQVLEESQCLLLSSKYEGFGLVLLEAMQKGLPIIAARNSSIVEVLGDSHLGFFETSNSLDLAERMADLQTPSHYIQLSRHSIDRITKFDPMECSLQTIKLYHRILLT